MATNKQTKISELRKSQLEQLNQAITQLTEKLSTLSKSSQKLQLLQSVSAGLYDEIDKLAKKAPADQITDMVFEQVNDFIRDAKLFLAEDPYILKLKEFVSAGNNPEHRDVVIVLRQLRQGLERFATTLSSARATNETLLHDAKGIHCAVEYSIRGETDITEKDLKEYETNVSERWMRASDYGVESLFSFDMLDRTDIPTFFSPQQ